VSKDAASAAVTVLFLFDFCRNFHLHYCCQVNLWNLLPHRASKFVVGTQLGILSIFNRSSGWGDCVDRVPGYVDIDHSSGETSYS